MVAKMVKQGKRNMTQAEQVLHSRVNAVSQLLDNATNDLLIECHSVIPDRDRVTLILIKIAAIALNEAQSMATT